MSDSANDNAYMAMLTRNIPGVGQPAPAATGGPASTLSAHAELTPLQDSAINVLAKAAEGALFVTEGEAPLEPVCIPASLLAQTETSLSPTWQLQQQQQLASSSSSSGGGPGIARRSSLTSHHLPSPTEFLTILHFLKNSKSFSTLLASLPPATPADESNVQCEVVSDIRSVLHPSDPGMAAVIEALTYLFLTKPTTNASVADAPLPTATLPSMSTQLRHQEPKNGHLSPSTATLDVYEAQHRYLAAYRVHVRGSTRVQVWILGALNDGSLVGYFTTSIES
ncbi:hypothetical protein BGZ73_004029 [Actinomortierella ambigua]|nr:hypothetical protein BGZ73_004029 [Actinomortierella ambigua]